MDSYKTIRKGGSLFRMLSLVLIFLIVPACSSTPDKEEQQSLGRKSYEEAISMQSLNMMDEMLAKLREAVQHDPNEPLYHLTLANALFSVEKLEEAEMYYKSAIKLNPQLTEGYRQLGRLYMQKADWKNAETYLEEAINRPGLSQPHELYNWLAITYYAQGILPRPHPPHSRGHWVIGASGHGSTPDYRLRHVDRDADAVAAWVRAHDDGQRRFLVELGHLGEALGWATRAQIVGGFTHRNLAHSMANLFRRVPSGALSEGDLRSYLDTYAIGWIIVSPDIPWLAGYRDLVEVKARIGPHVIYAVRSPAPLIAAGGGTVEASTNRIEVRGSDPGADLLLRFHWMETLACEPGCELRRVKIDALDPVGFIKVPAPHPADLEIVNTYEVRP